MNNNAVKNGNVSESRARRSPGAVSRNGTHSNISAGNSNNANPQRRTSANSSGTYSTGKRRSSASRTDGYRFDAEYSTPRGESRISDSGRGRTNGYSSGYGRTGSAGMGSKSGGGNNSRRTRYTPSANSRAIMELKREQKLLKKEEKRVKAEAAEKKWQSGVVRVKGSVDIIMLVIIIVLVALGSIMVFSASYPTAIAEGKDSLHYVKRQLLFAAVGLTAMAITSAIPYRLYKKWGPFVAYGISLERVGNARSLPTTYPGVFLARKPALSFQPSELMKVSLVLILAWYIEKFKPEIDARIDRWQTIKYNVVGPGIFVGTACILILLEKHLSGTIITGIIGVAVMAVGGCHFGWTMLISGLFLLLNPYALKRITTFTDDNADKLNELYQTTQGLYAIGSGGLFGLGFGHSRQKYSFVSAAHTDFIFTIWCEEMGFIGGLFLVLLFIAFIWRGYIIASRAPDTFSMLTAFGITTQVGIQAFLNMCVASDIIPNTGISLPFFSYGGSSLVVLLAEMGILLSISRQYYRKKEDIEYEKLMADEN